MTRTPNVVHSHPVASFFVLTIALSWVVWVPGFLLLPEGPAFAAAIAGGFGPAFAGGLVTWAVGDDVRAWAGRIVRWRRAPRWYLVALLLPPAVGALAVAPLIATGGTLTSPELPPLWVLPVGLVIVFLLTGGNEEPGWRGFALPRLQETHDPLTASAVIGAVWAVWHAPLYLLPGGLHYGASFAWFTVIVFGFSVLLTWLYNATNGSVFLCMLLHASINQHGDLPLGFVEGAEIPLMAAYAAAFLVTAGVIIALAGRDLGRDAPAPDRRGGDASLLSADP